VDKPETRGARKWMRSGGGRGETMIAVRRGPFVSMSARLAMEEILWFALLFYPARARARAFLLDFLLLGESRGPGRGAASAYRTLRQLNYRIEKHSSEAARGPAPEFLHLFPSSLRAAGLATGRVSPLPYSPEKISFE
jgi:hypothetical protein